MAIDWGAFVKGWAGSAADNIKEREKEARDKKMEEDRLALVEKYKIKEEDRADARAKKKVATEVADYGKGVALLYNADRELLGKRPLTASELQDRTFEVDAKKLGLDNLRSTIASRAASDRNDAIRTANDGSRTRATIDSLRKGEGTNALDGSDDRGTTPADRLAMNILKQAGIKVEGTAQLDELNAARAAVLAAAKQNRPDLAFAIYTQQKLRK